MVSPNSTEPMLNMLDESAGTPNWCEALRMPWACAASATKRRNGKTIRTSCTASSNLPGTAWKPGANRFTKAGVKIMPSAQNEPTTTMISVPMMSESSRASSLLFVVR